jgi:N6-adenosine-specific RNA methylase IME4
MKFNILITDPPYVFQDSLAMKDGVKRSSDSQYSVLTLDAIKNLDIQSITADDALLALWVPGAMLQDGLDIMKKWGFKQKQVFVWVKQKKNPFKDLLKKKFKDLIKNKSLLDIIKNISSFNLNEVLSFGMGNYFRQTHEIALIGTKGKILQHIKNKSQRSVIFDVNYKHSQKPNGLHESLDLMFPDKKLLRCEFFARREYEGYQCVGNEIPGLYFGEDIRDSIKRLADG